MIADNAGSVVKAGLNIFSNKTWIFLEHILNGITGGEKF